MDFVIGGLAGAGATIITNPMDVVKTRLQLQGELRAKTETSTRYRGIFHALYVIARNDGVMALQKGLAPAMVFGFTMNSVRLGLYHVAEVQGWTKNKQGDISFEKAILWSSISGVLSGVTGNPASVLKTRIQAAAHPSIAVGRQHRYNGMIDGFAQIYKAEGMRGYFAGVNATCTRLAIGSAAQLTTFSSVKEALLSHDICTNTPVGLAFAASAVSGVMVAVIICPFDVTTVRLYNQAQIPLNPDACGPTVNKHSRVKEILKGHGYFENSPEMRAAIASLISSVLCVIVETPLDVVNTRLYNQGSASQGALLYTGVLDCLTKIYKTEGFFGLYKGIGPLYLRIAPHTTLSLVLWDTLNNFLIPDKNKS